MVTALLYRIIPNPHFTPYGRGAFFFMVSENSGYNTAMRSTDTELVLLQTYWAAEVMGKPAPLASLRQHLTPREQEIFDQRFSRTLTPRGFCAIARALSCDDSTVRYHYRRGLRRTCKNLSLPRAFSPPPAGSGELITPCIRSNPMHNPHRGTAGVKTN